MKYFYSHLIAIDSIIEELDEMDLSDEEKIHLGQLLDSSLHHTILDAILSQLSDSDKRAFMQCITEGNHDKIWKFLNEKTARVEDKIKKAAKDLKEELQEDIEEVHKLK